ncbi:MAG: hypothetical protein HRT60_02160 [Dinoroseobacter sp.]|nr:hypothetical protein [Dinoroseobacter sp.]NQZ71850.1 hypothetical protein [Dinoroseobacter sp.]
MTLILYSLTALLLGISLVIATSPSRSQRSDEDILNEKDMDLDVQFASHNDGDVLAYEEYAYFEAEEHRELGDADLFIPPRDPNWIENFDPSEDTIYMSVDGSKPLPELSFEDLDADGVVLANGTPVLVVRNAAGLLNENSVAFTTKVFEDDPHQGHV